MSEISLSLCYTKNVLNLYKEPKSVPLKGKLLLHCVPKSEIKSLSYGELQVILIELVTLRGWCQVVGVVLANALMHSILRSSSSQPGDCDGLQPPCQLTVRRTASDVDDVKADLL